MPRIPYELFRLIFEHLEHDHSSLCSVAQSSRACCGDAQLVLFRNVTSLKGNIKHLEFLRTIIASPTRLALLVRSYRQERYDDDPVEDGEEILDVICEALDSMWNLKRLYLDVEYVHMRCLEWDFDLRPWVAWILRDRTFRLEHLDWKNGTSRDFDEIISRILPQQRNLKHLGLFGEWDVEQEEVTSIRPSVPTSGSELVSLATNWHAIEAVVAGHRNVTTLTMLAHYKDDERNTDMSILVPKFKNVKALSYQLAYMQNRTRHLEFILRHLPSLTVLELLIFDEDEDLSFLQQLPDLHTLIIPRRSMEEEMTRRIFGNSNINLQCIDLESYEGNEYLRYTRSRDDVQIISSYEARKWWLCQE